MDYRFNSFKKHIQYFLERQDIEEGDESNNAAILLYSYINYINNNYVAPYSVDSEDKDRIIKDILANNKGIPSERAMYEVLSATQVYMNASMSVIKKTADDYEKDLRRSQEKNAKLRVSLMDRIIKLEQQVKEKPSYNILTKMHLAFKAGQESMESDTPVIRKHNFKYWANKIWKYGKAKLCMPSTCSHPIFEDDMREDEPILVAHRQQRPAPRKIPPINKNRAKFIADNQHILQILDLQNNDNIMQMAEDKIFEL